MARRKPTKVEKDRIAAQKLAKGQASPYRKAAEEVQADIDRGMSDADIAKKYGEAYGAAGATAAAYAPKIAASSGNVGSLIGGLAGMLPGGTTDYGVTSMLAGIKDEASSNSFLAGLFGQSAGIDVGSAAAAGISGAQGRAADRVDSLSKEKRGLTMQGDVVAGDYLSQMNNVLGIRSARENLALSKIQTAAAKKALEEAGRGGSGSGSSTEAPPKGETAAQKKAREARERSDSMNAAAKGNIAGLNSMISGGYQPADMGSNRPAPGLRY